MFNIEKKNKQHAHTFTDDKIIKRPFNKNNVVTIKTNKIQNSNNYLITRFC